jgi:hypothetical protein
MLGAPGDQIEKIHAHILDMAKPIAMLNKASSSTLLVSIRKPQLHRTVNFAFAIVSIT